MDTDSVHTVLFSLTAIRSSTSRNRVPTGQLNPKCKLGLSLELILRKHLAQPLLNIPQHDPKPLATIATLAFETELGPLKRGDSSIPGRTTQQIWYRPKSSETHEYGRGAFRRRGRWVHAVPQGRYEDLDPEAPEGY